MVSTDEEAQACIRMRTVSRDEGADCRVAASVVFDADREDVVTTVRPCELVRIR